MPSTSADISVIVCAYTMDRWDELNTAIAALKGQNVSPFEIIVVIDHNPDLYERVQESIEDVIVVENTGIRGLSGARNSGIGAAHASIIAFVDEDAVTDADWIARLNASYTDPAILGVGGAIDPQWVSQRPTWFPDEFAWVVGCTYLG
ncbi:MAG: glycosyltransferase family 2 protein, partial [Anaerolineae bacterium]|nr:glycosyltransferase family 2 protein [Anaerolineae bacterium]